MSRQSKSSKSSTEKTKNQTPNDCDESRRGLKKGEKVLFYRRFQTESLEPKDKSKPQDKKSAEDTKEESKPTLSAEIGIYNSDDTYATLDCGTDSMIFPPAQILPADKEKVKP